NSRIVTLDKQLVADADARSLSCRRALLLADLAPGASINCTASHTIVQADLDAGHFFNQACVDDGANGADKQCASVDTPGVQNPRSAERRVGKESRWRSGADEQHYTTGARKV